MDKKYQLIIDFKEKQIQIPKDTAIGLDNPLEFNYLMHFAKKIFAVAGELKWYSTNGRQRSRPLRKSRVEQFWNESKNMYIVPAGEVILNKIGECIPDFHRGGVYTLSGRKDDEQNFILFNLQECRMKNKY